MYKMLALHPHCRVKNIFCHFSVISFTKTKMRNFHAIFPPIFFMIQPANGPMIHGQKLSGSQI